MKFKNFVFLEQANVKAQEMRTGINIIISWQIFLFVFRGGSDNYKGWTKK